ncbi:MAG: hypothetical protein KIS63_02020 [Caldilineales bacterium]|nr:hypothetical protein [Caldilineales bacterium]
MKNQLSTSGQRSGLALLSLFVLFAGALWLSGSFSALLSPPSGVSTSYACDGALATEAEIAASHGLSVETIQLLHTQRGLSNEAICAMPADKLARAVEKASHPKPDHPDEAVAFRLLQLRDENGVIPEDGLTKAVEHMEAMRGVSAQQAGSAGIEPGDWTWLGPGNIGGRVRSIVIHPTNPSLMWAGSVSGGIWKTTDAGASWLPVDDFMANLAVATLVMQPGNPSIMYAGTGEGFYNGDGIRGAGVFKSTNGGSTWARLASTATSDWFYVNRLAISANGAVILAANDTGIWRSTNGGTSWALRLADWRVKDIDFHPTSNTKAIASGSEGMAWYSTDGGLTWNMASGLPSLDWLGRVEVAYAPSSPSTVYASVSQNSGEIWRSTDGGQSYSLRSTGYNYLGGQGWYDNIVWVDPSNASKLVVGGIDLWRSTDGGATLTQISQWWSAPASAHADHHAIVAKPGFNGTTNATVYFGNDGGVYRANNVYTVNGTTGWQELNNNLGITQFYGAAGNPTSGVIVGGTQDNGTLRYTGNTESWTTMFGGDGGFDAADPTDPNYFYGEYVYLSLHRSTNGGATSDWIYSGLGDAFSCANFIAPFILDPNNANTMLAGGCSLWRSTNIKAAVPSWSSIKPSLGSAISAIAVAQGNSSIIWVGYNDGSVYKTTNGTAASPTWVRVDTGSPGLPYRYVTRLTIDRTNHNLVYATFGGFSADNVWRTTDGGATWSDITGSGATGLPDAPVRSLVIHPTNANWLYVGTEVGVFASENGGAAWSLPQDGPANVSVDELFWMNNTLVAATHGRGLFKVGVGGPPARVTVVGAFTADGNWNQKSVFAPGDPIQWVLEVQNDTGQDAPVELTYDARGPHNEAVAYWHGTVTTGPGVWWWGLPGTAPSGLDGTHTFAGAGLYQGFPSQASTTYVVGSNDVIFADSFEASDCQSSPWSACVTDGGNLSFGSPALKSPGNRSLRALINDNQSLYVVDTRPNAESRYRARFYFDPNSILMASGDNHYIFYGYSGTSKIILRLQFRYYNAKYQIKAGLLSDGSTWTSSSWLAINDAPHAIEFDWRAATSAGANNGGLTLWIDGVQKANLTGIDNDTLRFDQLRLGAVVGVDTGTRGTYYFDAFDSRRQSYIGPIPSDGGSTYENGPIGVPARVAAPPEESAPDVGVEADEEAVLVAPPSGFALAIPPALESRAGAVVDVPISLSFGSGEVAGLGFSLTYDPSWLSFDPTDADSDGLPDAISFKLPGAFDATVTWDGSSPNGELLISLENITSDKLMGVEGALLTVSFATAAPEAMVETVVDIGASGAWVADAEGIAYPMPATRGSVRISPLLRPDVP